MLFRSEAVVKREQDSLLVLFQPYYELDKKIEKDAISKLKENYHTSLKGILPSPGLAGMEASHHSGTRAETQRTAKRTSMEIVRQWTRPVVERQRPSHAQSTSQQRLSTNGALQSLVKGLTTESTT